MAEAVTLIPEFKWAQDKSHVYMTIELADVENEEIKLEENNFHFRGSRAGKVYEFGFTFHEAINPEASKWYKHRLVEFLIEKKDTDASFWPWLLKEKAQFKGRCHTDFNKWVDEDEDEKLLDNIDTSQFQDFQNQGTVDQMSQLNELLKEAKGLKANATKKEEEEDSDDEEMPDLVPEEPKVDPEEPAKEEPAKEEKIEEKLD